MTVHLLKLVIILMTKLELFLTVQIYRVKYSDHLAHLLNLKGQDLLHHQLLKDLDPLHDQLLKDPGHHHHPHDLKVRW